ncbi:hypothetical protein [Microbacterium sp. NPDC076911]|uniref:hypothetical protein n=1 Tax=Microbacterium sp. NPDC076911 TaxID=3154958 RepID=UPI003430DF89
MLGDTWGAPGQINATIAIGVLLTRELPGVVAGVVPLRFPFVLIARDLAPAILTGNTATGTRAKGGVV